MNSLRVTNAHHYHNPMKAEAMRKILEEVIQTWAQHVTNEMRREEHRQSLNNTDS